MILGFKTGPKSIEEGKRIALEDGARMCEVWFNVLEADSYDPLFDWMKSHDVRMGLHHWGVAKKHYKTNLASGDEGIRTETIEQIKQTIDIAQEIDAVYVNAHPGSRSVEEINLTNWKQALATGSTIPEDIARTNFLTSSHTLFDYAAKKNILLTMETLPGAETHGDDREDTFYPGNASLDWLQEMCAQGGKMANDITHALGTIALGTQGSDAMWDTFMSFTRSTAASTHLLHINTVLPPFNGTDSHDGITDADFAAGVFPDRERMKEWLRVFQERDDVYAVLEPKGNTMQENYRALVRLAQEL